jgi:hypothetical protein
MPDYSLCGEGDGCKMSDKVVTFHHVCVDCSRFLHVICGVTTNDDDMLLCHRYSLGCQAGPMILEPFPEAEEQTGDSSNLQHIPNNVEEQTGASSNRQNTPTTEKQTEDSVNLQNTSGFAQHQKCKCKETIKLSATKNNIM